MDNYLGKVSKETIDKKSTQRSVMSSSNFLLNNSALDFLVNYHFSIFEYIAEFSSYLNYCKALRFEDRPDYSHLRKMFKELLVKEGYEYDFAFDWVIMNEKLLIKENA